MIKHYFSIWCEQVVYYVQNIQKSRSEHTTKNSQHDWTSMHQLDHFVFIQKRNEHDWKSTNTNTTNTNSQNQTHMKTSVDDVLWFIHYSHLSSIFCVNVEINVLLIEIFIDFKTEYYVNRIFSYVKQFLQKLVNRNAINKHLNFDSITEQTDFDISIIFNIVDSDDFDENVAF